MIKNPPVNEEDPRHVGLIPGSGRSPGEGNGTPLRYSGLEISWTEKPGGLQSMGSQRVGHTEWLSAYIHICTVQNWKYISRWVVGRKKSNEGSNSVTRDDSSVFNN